MQIILYQANSNKQKSFQNDFFSHVPNTSKRLIKVLEAGIFNMECMGTKPPEADGL